MGRQSLVETSVRPLTNMCVALPLLLSRSMFVGSLPHGSSLMLGCVEGANSTRVKEGLMSIM